MEVTQPVSTLDLKGLPPRLRQLKRRLGMAAKLAFGAHAVTNYALSITFVGDREIASLNRRALGRKGPTDVIAFDLSEEGLPYGVVGDVYISLDRARAASKALKISESESQLRKTKFGPARRVMSFKLPIGVETM